MSKTYSRAELLKFAEKIKEGEWICLNCGEIKKPIKDWQKKGLLGISLQYDHYYCPCDKDE